MPEETREEKIKRILASDKPILENDEANELFGEIFGKQIDMHHWVKENLAAFKGDDEQ